MRKYWEEKSPDRATRGRLTSQNQGVTTSLHSRLQMKSSHIGKRLAHKTTAFRSYYRNQWLLSTPLQLRGFIICCGWTESGVSPPSRLGQGKPWMLLGALWEQGSCWLPTAALPPPGVPAHGVAAPEHSSLVPQLCLSRAGEGESGHQVVAAAGGEPKCLRMQRNRASESHKTHAREEPAPAVLLLRIWKTLPN